MNFDAFTRAVAMPGQPEVAFQALSDMVSEEIGVKLFTALTIDESAGLLRRSFSTMPDAYPVKGTKKMSDTIITARMMGEREPILSDGPAAVEAGFYDYELIFSLGCESCLNVPIVVAGEVIGSINLLHEAGHYTPERIETARAMRLPAALAFLVERQWGEALAA
ncbi:GAF domain-containing protein [Acuticoccus sp. I52.16.1]|uniref:GAF domain-containing protein n=1 Tax=Acuticoccus sp. I52.16.1 TaxID=2928472 RepID=UPI001FD2B6D0|nr:GAF domain-containing protein [Acuticoccus sp. I52.16.1]UOM32717.1 GAF domain-containing protein [Acuticoccus sp. I52.16.1]